MVLTGLAAVLLESLMVVPYLVAVDRLGESGNTWLGNLLSLTGYCLLMILPAALLTLARHRTCQLLEPMLIRINDWIHPTLRRRPPSTGSA